MFRRRGRAPTWSARGIQCTRPVPAHCGRGLFPLHANSFRLLVPNHPLADIVAGKHFEPTNPRSSVYSAVHRPMPRSSTSVDTACSLLRSANASRSSSPAEISRPSSTSARVLAPLKPSDRMVSGAAAARSSGLGNAYRGSSGVSAHVAGVVHYLNRRRNQTAYVARDTPSPLGASFEPPRKTTV